MKARKPVPVFLLLLFAVLLGIIGPDHVFAALPLGEEFQVNVSTTGDQQSPDVAATADGGFVVVWQSAVSPFDPAAGLSILARRFDAEGQAVGGEMQVNVETTYSHREPRVANREDGSFIVQWLSAAPSPKGLLGTLRARPYDVAGAPIRADFQVVLPPNIYTVITSHDVAASAPGEFVVASADFYTLFNGSYTSTITVQRFADTGSAAGSVQNLKTDSDQLEVAINAGHPTTGEFVIAWRGITYNTQYNLAESLRLGADGSPQSALAEVHDPNGVVSGAGIDASFTDQGDWVVVWDGYDSYQLGTTDGGEVFSRGVAASGTVAASGEVQINAATTNSQARPQLARGVNGTFLASWIHPDPVLGNEIRGRVLDRQGAPLGSEIEINSFAVGSQIHPRIAASRDRRQFLVVWTTDTSSDSDTDGRSIRAQRFLVGGIFVDDFESGGLSRWSVSVPSLSPSSAPDP